MACSWTPIRDWLGHVHWGRYQAHSQCIRPYQKGVWVPWKRRRRGNETISHAQLRHGWLPIHERLGGEVLHERFQRREIFGDTYLSNETAKNRRENGPTCWIGTEMVCLKWNGAKVFADTNHGRGSIRTVHHGVNSHFQSLPDYIGPHNPAPSGETGSVYNADMWRTCPGLWWLLHRKWPIQKGFRSWSWALRDGNHTPQHGPHSSPAYDMLRSRVGSHRKARAGHSLAHHGQALHCMVPGHVPLVGRYLANRHRIHPCAACRRGRNREVLQLCSERTIPGDHIGFRSRLHQRTGSID